MTTTRDTRIVAAYRSGDFSMRELAKEMGISHVRVSQILREAGIAPKPNWHGRPRSNLPDSFRKSFVGGPDMDAMQLAYGVKQRLDRSRAPRVFVLADRGRVYAPTKDTESLQMLFVEFPQMLVGCYDKGAEVGDIAEDLECARRAA